MSDKQSMNPKDVLGAAKNPHCCVPLTVLAELGVAMMEGSRKYGRHNYRCSDIRASIYYDAARRHIDAWWEGEDIDPDSGIHHIVKAIASLVVCRDGEIHGKLHDDRPPKTPPEFYKHLAKITAGVVERYPDEVKPYIEKVQKTVDRCPRDWETTLPSGTPCDYGMKKEWCSNICRGDTDEKS